MEYKLVNGDYAFGENGGLLTVDGDEKLLQRTVQLLSAKRRRFYPNKNFGSLLDRMDSEPYEQYALAYARQATEGLDGVFIDRAAIVNGAAVFKVIINRREYEVSIANDL